MFPQMLGEITLVDASVIALRTSEFFFAGVNPLMRFHVPLFPEFLPAELAGKVSALLVNGSLVAKQTAPVEESHRARVANVISTTL